MDQAQATHKILEEIKDFNPGITIETCKMFEFYLNLGIAIGFDLGNAMRGSPRRIVQYNKFGVKIREFESRSEASRNLKIAATNITQVCKGKRKTAGGFRFAYKT